MKKKPKKRKRRSEKNVGKFKQRSSSHREKFFSFVVVIFSSAVELKLQEDILRRFLIFKGKINFRENYILVKREKQNSKSQNRKWKVNRGIKIKIDV